MPYEQPTASASQGPDAKIVATYVRRNQIGSDDPESGSVTAA
jgi:hypothetical protein